jgi:hypothetical protein
MKQTIAAMVALPLLASLAGCGGGGGSSGQKEQIACAAVMVYAEPILTIRSAVDATTQQPIPVVTVTDLKRNGVSVNLQIELLGSNPVNVAVSGSTATCTVACAFMNEPGTLTFTAQAPGYQAKAVTVDASYASKAASCPTTYGGGTRLDLSLTPVGPA